MPNFLIVKFPEYSLRSSQVGGGNFLTSSFSGLTTLTKDHHSRPQEDSQPQNEEKVGV